MYTRISQALFDIYAVGDQIIEKYKNAVILIARCKCTSWFDGKINGFAYNRYEIRVCLQHKII